ncbi:MAG: hypothetical protein IT328_14035 [Caldilineaceae bacterium]|nr:hypothetical protein [Caldilineaceae bacterium]
MLEVKDGFEFQGLYCYPDVASGNPMRYFYLPSAAAPETDSQGRPTLLSIPAGDGGFLQFGVMLDAPTEKVEALRAQVAQRLNVPNPAVIQLAMAPITVKSVDLLIGDGSGQFSQTASNESSGFPPYITLFHLQADKRQQQAVAAALNGRPDFMQVHYQTTLSAPLSVTVKIEGDVRTILSQLPPANVPGDFAALVQALIEQGIARGELTLETETEGELPPDLVQRAVREAMAEAATLLQKVHRGQQTLPDVAHATFTSTHTQNQEQPFTLVTDVGDWFKAGGGADHLHLPPGSSGTTAETPPVKTSVEVELGFVATEAPIVLIQVNIGEIRATLVPPAFSAVRLSPVQAGMPLTVNTSYSNGSSPYQVGLDAAPRVALQPGDLGIAQVTVNGTGLQEARAQSAHVQLRYQPDQAGTAAERALFFQKETWRAVWFVVTKSADLAGILEYSVKIVNADGTITQSDTEQTTSTQIVLMP